MEIRKSLRLNLQHFASQGESTGEGEADSVGTKDGETSDGKDKETDKEAGKESDEHMIPKSRFDEVNENYKTMKSELDRFKAEQAEAQNAQQAKEKEDAEQRGEFENLYNAAKTDLEAVQSESTSAKERVESLEGVINGLLETKLEGIDEDYHDLIPAGMTPEQKLSWVNNAEQKGIFGNKKQSSEPLGKQTNSDTSGTVDVSSMNPLQKMLSGYGK